MKRILGTIEAWGSLNAFWLGDQETQARMMLTGGVRGMENREHSIWEEPGKEVVHKGSRQSKAGDKGTN